MDFGWIAVEFFWERVFGPLAGSWCYRRSSVPRRIQASLLLVLGADGCLLSRRLKLGDLLKYLGGPFVGPGGRCLPALRLGLGLS